MLLSEAIAVWQKTLEEHGDFEVHNLPAATITAILKDKHSLLLSLIQAYRIRMCRESCEEKASEFGEIYNRLNQTKKLTPAELFYLLAFELSGYMDANSESEITVKSLDGENLCKVAWIQCPEREPCITLDKRRSQLAALRERDKIVIDGIEYGVARVDERGAVISSKLELPTTEPSFVLRKAKSEK